MKLLIFGDIVGKTGRKALLSVLPELKKKYQPDFVVANAENAAHGKGLTEKIYQELIDGGIDFMTTGDHAFDKKEGDLVFDRADASVIRPANLADDLPGKGWEILDGRLAVVNLQGQVFMQDDEKTVINNPFHCAGQILADEKLKNLPVIVDFHAEATSEKAALALYLDGRVVLVFGTHTHVQTNDGRILPQGTGFISDIGMCGGAAGVIGDSAETVLPSYLTDAKHRMNPADFPALVSGIFVELDESKRTTKTLETFNLKVANPL